MKIRAGKKNIIYLPTNSYNSSQPSLCDTCRKLKFLNKKLNWLETKGDSLIDQLQNVMSFYIWDQHQLSLDDVTLIRLEQYHQPSLHSMVKKKRKRKKKKHSLHSAVYETSCQEWTLSSRTPHNGWICYWEV